MSNFTIELQDFFYQLLRVGELLRVTMRLLGHLPASQQNLSPLGQEQFPKKRWPSGRLNMVIGPLTKYFPSLKNAPGQSPLTPTSMTRTSPGTLLILTREHMHLLFLKRLRILKRLRSISGSTPIHLRRKVPLPLYTLRHLKRKVTLQALHTFSHLRENVLPPTQPGVEQCLGRARDLR